MWKAPDNTSGQLTRRVYSLVSGAWAIVLLLMWEHSVWVGTVTLTTQVITVEGLLLSALVLLAVWRKQPTLRLNALLLIGMTIWVLSRLTLRILVEGSLQSFSYVLVTAMSALAFTVLPPAGAIVYGVVGWLLLALATALSSIDQWDTLVASAFSILMVAYAALSSRQVIAERDQRRAAELQASTDRLTGLPNRLSGEIALSRSSHAYREHGTPASIVLLDIDHFKSVNDRFGHAAGDEALRGVAQALSENVREGDVLCRWGGEEFLLILQGVPLEQAAEPLGRVFDSVRQQEVPGVGRVTISAGACDWAEAPEAEAALRLADERLYAAKAAGRDQVVLSEEMSAPAS